MRSNIRFRAWGLPANAELRGRRGFGPPGFRRACEHPEVVAVLRTISAVGGFLVLRDGWFEIVVDAPRDDLDTLAEAVARAFHVATLGSWEALTERGMKQTGLSDWWTGEIEGVQVQARPIGTPEDRTRWGAQIEASLLDPLPPGTVVTHRDLGIELGADSFRDIMLGSMLDLVSDDPLEVDRRLAVDGVRELVLELIHGLPGSRLLATHVEVVYRASVEDPWPWIAKTVELVLALRQ